MTDAPRLHAVLPLPDAEVPKWLDGNAASRWEIYEVWGIEDGDQTPDFIRTIASLRAELAAKAAECEREYCHEDDLPCELTSDLFTESWVEHGVRVYPWRAVALAIVAERDRLARFAGAVLRDDDFDNFDEYAIAAGLLERRGYVRTPFGAACVAAAESEASDV